jgi:hypothetical protein
VAANTAPIFVAVPNNKGQTWVNGDGAAATKDIFVAGSNGSRVSGISVCSTDTSDRDFHLYYYDGSTAYLLGTLTVPLGAGNTGTVPALNLLSLSNIPGLNPDGSITLKTGEKLQAANVATITAAKTVTVVALGGDY